MDQNQQPDLNDDDEYLLDVVKGRVGAKKKMAILNKAKLSKMEMDQLFTGDGEDIDTDI
jgi:hypothetical protein